VSESPLKQRRLALLGGGFSLDDEACWTTGC